MKRLVDALKPWLSYTGDVMAKNLEFLARNYREVIDTCYELINDVIDIESWISPKRGLPEEKHMEIYSKYLMYPMVVHVAYPNLNLLPILVLLGAVPQAFYTLRTVLEAFAIGLYADSKEDLRDKPWYVKAEHKSVRNASIFGIKDSLRKVLREVLSDEEGDGWINYILYLYQAISAWVHPIARIRLNREEELAAGILRAVMITTAERGVPPTYGLVLPMEYGEEDLDDLKHLNSIIGDTRVALAVIAYTWSADKDFTDREALRNHFERLATELRKLP